MRGYQKYCLVHIKGIMGICEAEVTVKMNRVTTTVCQPRLVYAVSLVYVARQPPSLIIRRTYSLRGCRHPFIKTLYWWDFHQYRVLKTHIYSLRVSKHVYFELKDERYSVLHSPCQYFALAGPDESPDTIKSKIKQHYVFPVNQD